jgi:hypothetical protein
MTDDGKTNSEYLSFAAEPAFVNLLYHRPMKNFVGCGLVR